MQVTMTNVNSTNVLYDYRTTSLYFDKASAVLVDATFEDVYSDHPVQTFSRIIKITDSSLWTVAGTPSNGDGNVGGLPMELIIAVVAVVVVVVVVIAVVLLLRKRGKSRKK